jgi:hypothetical protein
MKINGFTAEAQSRRGYAEKIKKKFSAWGSLRLRASAVRVLGC